MSSAAADTAVPTFSIVVVRREDGLKSWAWTGEAGVEADASTLGFTDEEWADVKATVLAQLELEDGRRAEG